MPRKGKGFVERVQAPKIGEPTTQALWKRWEEWLHSLHLSA